MPSNYETTNSSSQDPRIAKWYQDFQIHDQDRYPINPSKIILEDPETQIENFNQKDFQRLFFWTMSQGVAPDEKGTPHFFHPKTFLQKTNHKIFKAQINKLPSPYAPFANGLNSIVMFKNLPENQDNPTLQQEAKAAISEYLNPELFEGNFTPDDELIEINALLDPEVRTDKMINDCLLAADQQREQFKHDSDERSRERARKTDYQHIYEPTPNPESFKVRPDTTINQILDNLKNSPNRAAFERINALRKWGDYIQENISNPNYEEKIISFGSNSRTHHRYSQYSNDNTYAVIAFDYAGRRCMIAESCGSGGAKSTSAAMKIWRSEPEDLDNKQGWMQAFTQSKTAASEQNLLQSISHTGLTDAINQRNSDSESHIVEEEDRLFRLALHYFETGDLLGSGEEAVKKLDNFIGPKFRRPNPKS